MHSERLNKIPTLHRLIVRQSGNPKLPIFSLWHTFVAINLSDLTVHINLKGFAGVTSPSMHDFCSILLLAYF